MAYKVGELIKWREPIDEDYSYGHIVEVNRNIATIRCLGYYTGIITHVHIKYIRKVQKGGKRLGSSKRHSKRTVT